MRCLTCVFYKSIDNQDTLSVIFVSGYFLNHAYIFSLLWKDVHSLSRLANSFYFCQIQGSEKKKGEGGRKKGERTGRGQDNEKFFLSSLEWKHYKCLDFVCFGHLFSLTTFHSFPELLAVCPRKKRCQAYRQVHFSSNVIPSSFTFPLSLDINLKTWWVTWVVLLTCEYSHKLTLTEIFF